MNGTTETIRQMFVLEKKPTQYNKNEPMKETKSGYICYYINRDVLNEDNVKYWAWERGKVVYILNRAPLITGQEEYELL